MTESPLAWPGVGAQIADLMDEGRFLFTNEMNRHHWAPATGSPAYWDGLTRDPHFLDLGQAATYASTLVAGDGESLAGLATLYRIETTLTLAHYTVARSFIEIASSAWWVLSPGIESMQSPPLGSPDEGATQLSRQRLLRAMLLVADDLTEFHRLLLSLYPEDSPQVSEAKSRLDGHLERLRAWSGEEVRRVRRGKTVVGGERLLGYADRVRRMLGGIGAEGVPVYEMLSAYSHGMVSAFVDDISDLPHEGHLFFAWLGDPVKATWVAHVVLVIWERLARTVLAIYGHSQSQFDVWRDRVDELLLN
jgi:hypothetical protein